MSYPSHVESYYAASAQPAPQRAPLRGTLSCDVCVVGGGITGCSTALHLAGRGYNTVLLEAERIGWGASGRSGGQLLFGFSCAFDRLVAHVGADGARRLFDMSVEAVALTRRLVAEHGIECALRDGHLHAAIKPRQRRELIEWQRELADTCGYASPRFVEGEALRAVIDSPRYLAGLYDPASAHLHPLDYTLGLARAAEQAGARLFEASRVTELSTHGAPMLRTADAELRCRYLVLCGNAYLGALVPRLRSRIMPVGSYIAATAPLGAERLRALLPTGAAVADVNFILDYFRPSPDHRLLFGGRVSYSSVTPPRLTQSLRGRMLRVFPGLSDVAIDYVWGGHVAITLNRAPHFGRLRDDVYFAQGFSGHGLALTGLAGKLIADAIAGTAERFDLFARIPHAPFPGGELLRTPALVLGMLFYRLRDLL